ncbi:unnamed protein product [Soboliphyme baturini]|uniref:CCHC-type domain-containing protein n=1 Tax=Soboliphyme baturini TaxID=241478 RepID=A0A183IR52_9BILA|nr:unnamed protein product [Soboliphyme baturini]
MWYVYVVLVSLHLVSGHLSRVACVSVTVLLPPGPCFNCGQYGYHIASKCRAFPQNRSCYHCRSADHLVSQCPKMHAKHLEQCSDGQDDDRPTVSASTLLPMSNGESVNGRPEAAREGNRLNGDPPTSRVQPDQLE